MEEVMDEATAGSGLAAERTRRLGLLDAMRSVTRGVPDTWTVSVIAGVAYRSRCVDCSILA